jgi:hypothetical protein
MRRAVQLTIAAGFVVFSFVAPRAAQAQTSETPAVFTLDEGLAKKGKSLWTARACSGCHTIGKVKMPNMKLTDDETLALIHHIAKESQKVKKSEK